MPKNNFFVVVVLLPCILPFVPSLVWSCTPPDLGIHLARIRTLSRNHEKNKLLLLAYIEQNSCIGGCNVPNDESILATIDISTGQVTPAAGPVENATTTTLIPLPKRNVDPVTANYTVEFNGTSGQLIDHDGFTVVADLEIPDTRYGLYRTFFVSNSLMRAFILLEFGVLIVDLLAPSQQNATFSIFSFPERPLPYWFDGPIFMGDATQHITVYDDIQVMVLFDVHGQNWCLGRTFFFFNESGVHVTWQSSWWDSGDMLDAIVYGEHPNENSAILVIQGTTGESVCPRGGKQVCTESHLEEISVSTGKLLRTIQFNIRDLLAIGLGNYTAPVNPTSNPTDAPTSPNPSPTTDAPTPMGSSGLRRLGRNIRTSFFLSLLPVVIVV